MQLVLLSPCGLVRLARPEEKFYVSQSRLARQPVLQIVHFVKTLLTEAQIQTGVADMARRIHVQYEGAPLTLLGVMTGSIVLVADLIRRLELPLRVGVLQASSYRGGTTRGELVINSDLMPDIRNRDVLIVDDIFDTGHTMVKIVELLQELGPKSVRTAVLLRKAGRQEVSFLPDFVAFEIPDEFVVGYGLDYQDHFRNLPYVAVLEPQDLRPFHS